MNSAIAIVATISIVAIPLVLNCALRKYWSPAVTESNANKKKPATQLLEGGEKIEDEPQIIEKSKEAMY